MNFVHEVDPVTYFAEFVFGISEDQPLPGGDGFSAFKQGKGIGRELIPFFGSG